MPTDEHIAQLRAILITLEQIELRGESNISKMLGCMQAIKKTIDKLQKGDENQ